MLLLVLWHTHNNILNYGVRGVWLVDAMDVASLLHNKNKKYRRAAVVLISTYRYTVFKYELTGVVDIDIWSFVLNA